MEMKGGGYPAGRNPIRFIFLPFGNGTGADQTAIRNILLCDILSQPQDAEECENETYWKAWQAIPPNRPHSLKAFLGKITRNLALHFWERNHAAKRGGNDVDLALDELTECIPANDSVEQAADAAALQACLQSFLQQLPRATRIVFVQRYWYLNSIAEIAQKNGMGESKVKMILLRTRKELKAALETEGISI